MAPSSRPSASSRSSAPTSAATARPAAGVTCTAALLVPGAGHFLQEQRQKAVVFFVVLVAMFAIGLGFGGRLFPFQLSDPLVFLAASAQWILTLPRLAAAMGGWGQGNVVASTYEYGNTFLITAGLMNALVVLDAFDLATGRKGR
jgi:Family of unknown function (DUF6677)